MSAPIIWAGTTAKLLKAILDLNGNGQILSGAVDPSSVATSAPAGSIYLSTSTNFLYYKTDAGSSTNWVRMLGNGLTLLLPNGAVGTPALAFANDTGSGLYRVASNNIGMAVNGVEGLDMLYIAASQANIGLGVAADVSAQAPLTANRTINNSAFYILSNLSTGTSSATILRLANGTATNHLQIENQQSANTTYTGGGSVIRANSNHTQIVISSEFSSGAVAFTVGGTSAATERMRVSSTALTLNGTIALKHNGSTSGTLTRAVPATITSYTKTSPAAQATAYRQVESNDLAGNMSWVDLGRINKNYVGYPDFENNATTGWSATGCATVTNGLPASVGSAGAAFSSGNGGRAKGANTNAPAVDSSSAIRGTYALNLATTGAGVIGDGYISDAVTIEKADQAKVLTYRVHYKVASGTPVMAGTSTDTYAVAIYDIVNNAWLPAAGNFSFTQSSGVGIATGTVQTASNTTGVQLFIYSPIAPTGTSSLLIDDVYLGAQTVPIGAVLTDWQSYTPTYTGFGTVTPSAVYWRRVGDTLQVRGRYTTGTPTAVEARIAFPAGLTSASTIVTIEIAGVLGRPTTSTTLFGATVLREPSVTYFTIGQVSSTNNAVTKQNGNVVLGTSEAETFYAEAPIAGWSSNVQLSNDTDTRLVSFFGTQATQAVTANVTNIAFTTSKDTHGAWTGTTFVVPVSGDYVISGNILQSATGSIQPYKNAVVTTGFWSQSGSGTGASCGSVLIPNCVAGDILSVRDTVSLTVTLGQLGIYRLSGPAVIAATESVNARYFACATALSGSLATLSWTTRDFDSHGAMSSGTYTVPVAGKYQVNVGVALTAASAAAGNAIDVQIQKNGSVVSEFSPVYQSTQVLCPVVLDDIINCLAGDTIRVQVSSAATTPAITSSNSKNFFSIARVGN